MVVSDHYPKKNIHTIQFKLRVYTYLVNVRNCVVFGPRSSWLNFGPLVATRWLKMVVSDHYLKKYHAIQFKIDVYTYWVSVQNWFTFGPYVPNFGPLVATKLLKMVVSDHYLKKMSTHSNSNLCTLIGWVFAFGPRWPNFGPLVSTKWLKMVASDHYLKKYHDVEYWSRSISNMVFELIRWVFTNYSIYSKHGVYTD